MGTPQQPYYAYQPPPAPGQPVASPTAHPHPYPPQQFYAPPANVAHTYGHPTPPPQQPQPSPPVQPPIQQFLAELPDTHVVPKPSAAPAPAPAAVAPGYQAGGQVPGVDPLGVVCELPSEPVTGSKMNAAASSQHPPAQAVPWGFFLDDQPKKSAGTQASPSTGSAPSNAALYQAHPWGYFGPEEGFAKTKVTVSTQLGPNGVAGVPVSPASNAPQVANAAPVSPASNAPQVAASLMSESPASTAPQAVVGAGAGAGAGTPSGGLLSMGAMASALPSQQPPTASTTTSPISPSLVPAPLHLYRPPSSGSGGQPHESSQPANYPPAAHVYQAYVPPAQHSAATQPPGVSGTPPSGSLANIQPYRPSMAETPPLPTPPYAQPTYIAGHHNPPSAHSQPSVPMAVPQPQAQPPLAGAAPASAGINPHQPYQTPVPISPPIPTPPIPQPTYAPTPGVPGVPSPGAQQSVPTPALPMGSMPASQSSPLATPASAHPPPSSLNSVASSPQPQWGSTMPGQPYGQQPPPNSTPLGSPLSPPQQFPNNPSYFAPTNPAPPVNAYPPQPTYVQPLATPPVSDAATLPSQPTQKPTTHLHHTPSLPSKPTHLQHPASPPPAYEEAIQGAQTAPPIRPGSAGVGGPYNPPVAVAPQQHPAQPAFVAPMPGQQIMPGGPGWVWGPPLPPRPMTAMPNPAYPGYAAPQQPQYVPVQYGAGSVNFPAPPPGPAPPGKVKLFSKDMLGKVVKQTTQVIDQAVQEVNNRYGTTTRPPMPQHQHSNAAAAQSYYSQGQPQYGAAAAPYAHPVQGSYPAGGQWIASREAPDGAEAKRDAPQ